MEVGELAVDVGVLAIALAAPFHQEDVELECDIPCPFPDECDIGVALDGLDEVDVAVTKPVVLQCRRS